MSNEMLVKVMTVSMSVMVAFLYLLPVLGLILESIESRKLSDRKFRKVIDQKLTEILKEVANKYLLDVEKTGYISSEIKTFLIREILEKVVYVSSLIDKNSIDCSIRGTEDPVPKGLPVVLLIEVVCKNFKPKLVVEHTVYGISKN